MTAYSSFGRADRGMPAALPDSRLSNASAPEPVEYFWQPINRGWIMAGVSFALLEITFELLYYGDPMPGLAAWAVGLPYLLYCLLGLLGVMWIYVMIAGNPYAVRMDERGLDIPTMYDRVIPWDKIVAIRTHSILGLFRVVHLTVGQRFEVGAYRRMQLPGFKRHPEAWTISVKKLGIPNWMTNGKLEEVLAVTKGFHEFYGASPEGALTEEELRFDKYHTI